MVNLVEAIVGGINTKYQYFDPSFSEPITYRAITRWEHEQAHANALEECQNEKVVKLLVGLGWRTITVDDEDSEFSIDDYKEFRMYQFDVMLWVCYYGLKDFQPDNFSIETLKESFVDLKTLSINILDVSVATREQIVEIIENRQGRELAYIIHVLNVPLVDEAWKITPLQLKFHTTLKVSMENPQPKGVEVTKDMIEKDPQRYKEYLKELFGKSEHSKHWRG